MEVNSPLIEQNNRKSASWSILLATFFLLSSALGQSTADIEALKKLAEQQRNTTVSEVAGPEVTEEIGPTMTEIKLPEEKATGNNFGYSFFSAQRSISLLNNLPVPADYILGPGDELILTLWGETEFVSKHTISKSNTIYIQRVGLLNLSGKNLDQARIFLKGKLENIYSTLKGPKARTFMDVAIGEIKSINVRFVGEVNNPGLYPIHPFSTVTTGLMQAGGVSTTGSLRSIQIIRDSKVVSEIDLYGFLLKGKTDGDIRLRDQDVVFVPVRESDVYISGQIRRSGVYELLSDETAQDLLDYSGGLKATARSPIEIKRIKQISQRSSEDTPREAYTVPVNKLSEWKIVTGDSVFVPTILPEVSEISIQGQVKSPGTYTFTDSIDLIGALRLAGGIDDPTFLKSIYLARGEVLRHNPESDHAIVIPFNVSGLINGSKKDNIPLQNQDVIVLRRAEHYRKPEVITMKGELAVPGVYSIKEDDETLESIITRAGGFTSNAFPDGLHVMRHDTRVVVNNYDIQVLNGDVITVPKRKNTVEVRGEVFSPALIHYSSRMSCDDYIESAGGLTELANKGNVSIIYPNGDIKIKSWLKSPNIVEGSIIVVHKKEDTEPFNLTEFLKETTSIAASLATIIFILSK